MGTSSRIAVMLDADMIARHGIGIAPAGMTDTELANSSEFNKRGSQASWELGGRYFVKYLLSSQVNYFARGSANIPSSFLGRPHYVTPTPFSPEEAVIWLAFPAPDELRSYVLFINPDRISRVLGPRFVRMGGGIEYSLPDGFAATDIVDVGPVSDTVWPLQVT